MSQSLTIPWNAWFSEEEVFTLTFPDDWKVTKCAMDGAEGISPKDIKAAFDTPIGILKIRDLARGKKSATIVIDDINRPTRAEKILKILIHEIEEGGILTENMKIIFALGAHRPMMQENLIKKIGSDIYHQVDVMNHYLYENLLDGGVSDLDTIIKINRYFMESMLKISVSCIVPHN